MCQWCLLLCLLLLSCNLLLLLLMMQHRLLRQLLLNLDRPVACLPKHLYFGMTLYLLQAFERLP